MKFILMILTLSGAPPDIKISQVGTFNDLSMCTLAGKELDNLSVHNLHDKYKVELYWRCVML
jgi:hypothetical protein